MIVQLKIINFNQFKNFQNKNIFQDLRMLLNSNKVFHKFEGFLMIKFNSKSMKKIKKVL